MIPDWATYCEWRGAFAEVIDDRYYSLDWLDMRLLNGEVRFWATPSAAIIAELREYPTGAMDVHGLIAAGDLREIIETLIPQAEQWGAAQGCIAALIESRPAWAKALAPFGYETHQVTVRKEL
jgi:hypothetical protein